MRKIYLDHNATTPLLQEVLDEMLPLYKDGFGNPSSVHSEGRVARVRLDEAREQVAEFIGAQPSEIVFTSGAKGLIVEQKKGWSFIVIVLCPVTYIL